MALEPTIHTVFEPNTSTWQYVVADPDSRKAVIIDPVLDYDAARNLIAATAGDNLLSLVAREGYIVTHILETHAHADHLTAAKYLKNKLTAVQGVDGKPAIGIGKRIVAVQERFAGRYGIARAEWDGAFDLYLDDDDEFAIGGLTARAMHLPGHTPDHLGYMIGSNVFCGDSLFNPDVGSARCDFPGGDASALYASASRLLSLPKTVRIYTGHDYPPGEAAGRKDPVPYTTVADQLEQNKHLKKGTSKEQFVGWRRQRDGGLAPPRLIHQSLQWNIRAGELPGATEGGDMLIHVPLKVGGVEW